MINWSRVAELREEVGAEDFEEIVELFLEEVDEVIGLLRGGDGLDELEDHMHFLKGSALNIGFSTFADLCQIGESLSAEGRIEDVDVDGVLDAYDAARLYFLAESKVKFAA